MPVYYQQENQINRVPVFTYKIIKQRYSNQDHIQLLKLYNSFVHSSLAMIKKDQKTTYRSQSLKNKTKKQLLQLPRFYTKPKNVSPSMQHFIVSPLKGHNDSKTNANNKKFRIKLDFRYISSPTEIQETNTIKPVEQSNKIKNNQKSKVFIKYKKKVNDKQRKSQLALHSQVYLKDTPKLPSEHKIQQKLPPTDHKLLSKSKTMIIKQAILEKKPIQLNTNKITEEQQNNYDEVVGKIQQHAANNWLAIQKCLQRMTKMDDDTKTAQIYIRLNRKQTQQRIFSAIKNRKFKNKMHVHLAIKTISVYLYIHIFIQGQDLIPLKSLFQKIYQSHQLCTSILFQNIHLGKHKAALNRIHIATLAKNNETVQKQLIAIFSKKKFPENQLFSSLLQSSIKIQTLQYLHIIDKTLKWEILQMPTAPYLPQTNAKYHLVLDLDQTLIHYQEANQTFHVRPFAEEFIIKASKKFEITIFTAATKEYADTILNEIDPHNKIAHRLYRNHITYVNKIGIKDLSLLGRPLNRTILVDNLESNFKLQKNNGILIKSWYGQDEDDVLKKLLEFLEKLIEKYNEDLTVGIQQHKQYLKEHITISDFILNLKNQL